MTGQTYPECAHGGDPVTCETCGDEQEDAADQERGRLLIIERAARAVIERIDFDADHYEAQCAAENWAVQALDDALSGKTERAAALLDIYERAVECGDFNDSDGWDGKCGNCADRAEDADVRDARELRDEEETAEDFRLAAAFYGVTEKGWTA
jgi:hypothetical protein